MSLPRTSLQFRLLVLVGLALVPIIGLQVFTVLQGRDGRLADLRQTARGVADLSARNVGQLLTSSREKLGAMAEARRLSADSLFAGFLARLLAGNDGTYTSLGWIRQDGVLMASSPTAPANTTLADQSWFRQLQLNRQFTVGEYQADRISRMESVHLAMPVAIATDKSPEAVFLALSLDALQRTIAQGNLPTDAIVRLVDRNGSELARWPETRGFRGQKTEKWSQLGVRTVPMKVPVELRSSRGEPRYYYFTPVPNSNQGLWVGISISQAEVMAEVRIQLWWRVGGMVLLTVIGLLLAWYGSEVFVIRPVKALIRASDQLAGGDFSARAEAKRGPGELSVLAQTFDQMAASVHKHQEDLRRTQAAVDFAPEPILWAAPNGRITYANESALGQYGYTMKEMLGLRFFNVSISPSADGWAAHWDKLKQERTLIYESTCRTRSGREIPVEITANYLEFENEEYLCAFLRDITVRKRNEAKLRELNASLEQRVKARTAALESANASLVAEINDRQRIEASLQENQRALATLMSNLPGMAYRCLNDEHWTMEFISEGAFDLAGYFPEQIIKNKAISYNQLIHPEDRQIVRDTVDAALEKRQPYRIIYRIVCADGSVKWVSEQGLGVFGKNGKLIALEGIVQDTTERKQAEEELYRAHQMLELILDTIPQRVFWKDRNLKYLGCNRSFAEDLALVSPQEIVGKTDYEISSHDDAERFRADDQQVMDSNTAKLNYEEPWQSRGKGLRWLRSSKVPLLNSDGQSMGVLCTYEDITGQREMQQQLKESMANLERSNRELEQFAYVASHDLQEPLRLISSYTQLLASRYSGKLDATGHEFIGFAVDGANRMQRLIQDLLAYSRVTSKDAPSVATDSNAALDEALANLRVTIEENAVQITRDPLPAVLAAEHQLVQLFQNLVGNSIKFRGTDNPRIHVGARCDEEKGEWIFSVSDNGIGIASEYFERIFAIFQRLHSRRKYAGTGIGLAVCKRIVERHGGRIWVESEPGKGSTFFFTLRATPPNP